MGSGVELEEVVSCQHHKGIVARTPMVGNSPQWKVEVEHAERADPAASSSSPSSPQTVRKDALEKE